MKTERDEPETVNKEVVARIYPILKTCDQLEDLYHSDCELLKEQLGKTVESLDRLAQVIKNDDLRGEVAVECCVSEHADDVVREISDTMGILRQCFHDGYMMYAKDWFRVFQTENSLLDGIMLLRGTLPALKPQGMTCRAALKMVHLRLLPAGVLKEVDTFLRSHPGDAIWERGKCEGEQQPASLNKLLTKVCDRTYNRYTAFPLFKIAQVASPI